MPRTVLHILSQRPGRTGSGVVLDSVVRRAQAASWNQYAIVGTPADDPWPEVADLTADRIHPLVFGEGELGFLLPGMSDVMPYPSSRWSALTPDQLESYRNAFRDHVARVVELSRPDVIHSHHVWILSSMIKDVAPEIPVVTTCHATGLRQMELCPHIAPEVVRGCSRNDRFIVLQNETARTLRDRLGLEESRVRVVPNGFREDLFFADASREPRGPSLVYAGKFSNAKGLPSLLDAVDRLSSSHPDLVLQVAGAGSGEEADALAARMKRMAPRVRMHGMLDQRRLAELMRTGSVFVLPSFYEGLPLVLIEAIACGCRAVSTALPGVVDQLAPVVGEALELVAMPRLRGVDVPEEDDLPVFVERLAGAIDGSLRRDRLDEPSSLVSPFQWSSVFTTVEGIWTDLIARD